MNQSFIWVKNTQIHTNPPLKLVSIIPPLSLALSAKAPLVPVDDSPSMLQNC